jgi:Aromatic-ring-opening dioxygenase LigAB, LigA subunit
MEMANNLSRLMGELAESLSLQRDYMANAEAVMTRYGLSDDEKAALRSGDEAAILREVGGSGVVVFKIILRPPT